MVDRGKRRTGDGNDLPVSYFGFRLSARDPEDRRLSELMAQDLDSRAVNLSSVAKRLLLAWYDWREATGEVEIPALGGVRMVKEGRGSGREIAEQRENPDDELVQALAGVSFRDWET